MAYKISGIGSEWIKRLAKKGESIGRFMKNPILLHAVKIRHKLSAIGCVHPLQSSEGMMNPVMHKKADLKNRLSVCFGWKIIPLLLW